MNLPGRWARHNSRALWPVPGAAVTLAADREVHSSRGATITSWREAERVLAGFADGRAASPLGKRGLVHDRRNATAPQPGDGSRGYQRSLRGWLRTDQSGCSPVTAAAGTSAAPPTRPPTI